jgi:hypothetical protein
MMADVEIQLILHDGGSEDGHRRCEPGSTVRGTALLRASEDVDCDHVSASLGWHTEGRGDHDSAHIDEVRLLQGPLRADTPISQSFSFRMPSEPWSYAGYYINIVWDITITVAIPFSRDVKHTEQIVVDPRRRDR